MLVCKLGNFPGETRNWPPDTPDWEAAGLKSRELMYEACLEHYEKILTPTPRIFKVDA